MLKFELADYSRLHQTTDIASHTHFWNELIFESLMVKTEICVHRTYMYFIFAIRYRYIVLYLYFI